MINDPFIPDVEMKFKHKVLEFLSPEHMVSRTNLGRTLISTMPIKMKEDKKYGKILDLFKSNLADGLQTTTEPDMQDLLDMIKEYSELLISFPIKKSFEGETLKLGVGILDSQKC